MKANRLARGPAAIAVYVKLKPTFTWHPHLTGFRTLLRDSARRALNSITFLCGLSLERLQYIIMLLLFRLLPTSKCRWITDKHCFAFNFTMIVCMKPNSVCSAQSQDLFYLFFPSTLCVPVGYTCTIGVTFHCSSRRRLVACTP